MVQAQLSPDLSQPHPPAVAPVDVSDITIEDGAPVDSIYSEKAQRLLTRPLYGCWVPPPALPSAGAEGGEADEAGEAGQGAPRPFVATANVGVFISPHLPPLVPDVLLSVDVALDPSFSHDKRHASYFIWEMGKAPDVVIEIVSNRKGDELGKRLRGYARMGVAYYVVWDPRRELGKGELLAFENRGGLFVAMDGPPSMPLLGLRLAPWEGEFEGVWARWLRWYVDGAPIPTGAERAKAEARRADEALMHAKAEARRADEAVARAERLAALLAAHGIDDPDGSGQC